MGLVITELVRSGRRKLADSGVNGSRIGQLLPATRGRKRGAGVCGGSLNTRTIQARRFER